MKILLTGAKGLVGSTINADIRIMGRDIVDLRDWNSTYCYFKDSKPDAVVHTAARVGGLGSNLNYMGEFFYDNMLINLNVLEAARRTNVNKVLSFMSTCIFPDNVNYPITEDMLHNGEPHYSNYGYAYAKRMLDVQSRAYNQQYGVQAKGNNVVFGTKYISVIPTNIYGPNDNFELENSHVVPALIHKCYIANRDKTPFVIWGSGKPLREFIYSEDVGRISKYLLEHYDSPEPLIISTGQEHSIRDLVIAVADCMDFQGSIIYDDNRPDGQYKKTTSNENLMRVLPSSFEFTPLIEGIKQTVDWFVENYETCRK